MPAARSPQIQNYVTGTADPATPDQDVTVLYSYTPDGKLATLTAVNGVTGDQVTQYVVRHDAWLIRRLPVRISCGRRSIPIRTTRPTRSAMAPVASTTAWSTRTTGWDKSSPRRIKTPRFTNTFTTAWAARRKIALRPSGLASTRPFCGSAQVTRFAECRKTLPVTITRRLGAGNVVNDVQLVYNAFGQLSADYQSHAGRWTWPAPPSVGYTYEDGTAGTIRRTGIVYPNGRVVGYQYAAGIDDAFNRVTAIVDGDSASAQPLRNMRRLGFNTFVQVDYPQPSLRYDLAFGTGTDPYAGIDQFGRIVDLRWWNPGTGQDVERVQHGYDLVSNRLWRQNPVAAALGVNMDELYSYDGVNQLATFARGQLTSDQTASSRARRRSRRTGRSIRRATGRSSSRTRPAPARGTWTSRGRTTR